MNNAFRYCESLVREADKDRYLSSLFAPAARRAGLHALYAFNTELARVRDHISGPLPGEVRLQWWRDVLSDTARGDVTGNPVAVALLATIEAFDLSRLRLDLLIDVRTFDLYDEPMPNVPDLVSYARSTSSVVMELAARILGDDGDEAVAIAVRHGGIAYGITGLLKAIPLHTARGQLFLPADLLARHQVDPADIPMRRITPGLHAALSDMRALARSHLIKAADAIDQIPDAVLPALLPIALVRPVLGRLERGRNPFAPVNVPQWRRQWWLWRAARNRARMAG